ncbi:MAG: hypothetical protein JJW00_04290 [Sulfurimonas sp.]|nr:hypothetical protein [Sulfurimonas sp.]
MNYNNLITTGLLQNEDIISTSEKLFIVDDVFAILQDAYKNVKGGLNFEDKDHLIQNTSLWKVIYLDEVIVGVIIYKAKKGLKMVALGISSFLTKKYNKYIKKLFSHIFKSTFRYTWMEVSEGVEHFIIKNGGKSFLLKNTLATQLTGKQILALDDDGYHYKREINGVVKSKVIIGTIKD